MPVTGAVLSATLAITGAAGGVASIVSTNPLDTELLLPAGSVALRVNVWLPFASGVCGVKLHVPSLFTVVVPMDAGLPSR